MLILDGHSSHSTPEFDQYCKDKKIVVVCLPPHSSHLLQPLDVTVFGPLKQAYSAEIMDLIRLGVNHVDKTEFLTSFVKARHKAFTASNIQSGFKATGVVPYNPMEVLADIPRPATPPELLVAAIQPKQLQHHIISLSLSIILLYSSATFLSDRNHDHDHDHHPHHLT
jgi:hypothetical protein